MNPIAPRSSLARFIPGLALTLALALAALWLAGFESLQRLGLSALPLAIVGGMLLGNTLYPALAPACGPGVDFSKAKLLRLGIILYGFKLTFQDIAAVGTAAIIIDTLIVALTFVLALWLGRRWLGMDEESSVLIGAGASICGAAAVLATEPVVRASPDKVTVAVATVVVFGTLGMFLYPFIYLLASPWGLDEVSFGIYTGSTVHEVAQVLAAGRAVSETAASTAVITKMIRVMLLAPFLLILANWLARDRHAIHDAGSRPLVIPWFAVAFIAMAGFNSLHLLPPEWVQGLIRFDDLALAMAMGALGLTTHVSAIRKAGARPLLLATALFGWLLIGGALINFGVMQLTA